MPVEIELQASYFLETRHVPDNYDYQVLYDRLYSPVTGEPVENSITINNAIEVAEMIAFQKIQSWASQNDTGVAAWISPRYPRNESTDAKVIFSALGEQNGNKILVNRSMMFGWDGQNCLDFASVLDPNGSYLSSEELRQRPIFLSDEVSQQLLTILETYDSRQVDMIRSGEDIRIKEGTISTYRQITQNSPAHTWETQAKEAGLIGEYKGSCPSSGQGAFNTMFDNSQHYRGYEFKPGTCRICGLSTEVGPCNICRSCEKKL